MKNSEDIINEFFHVEPLEETNNLHWLDPEMCIQFHSQRHTVRVKMRLHIEKSAPLPG